MALLVPPPLKRAAIGSKRKLQGVAFLVMLGLFFYLVVSLYNKSFASTVPISLRTDSIGNQLSLNADVKFRGVNVGQVKSLSTTGEVATLKLAMIPDQIKLIPSNVRARILPKTLFGQKYVDLVSPDNTSAAVPALKKGTVIGQDRSYTAIEIEQLYQNLLPFITAVAPDKLNETLSAMATAVEGRGDELGDNLARLDDYLRQINQHLPSIQSDVSELADFSQILNQAAPDLLRFLANNVVTGRTIVEKQKTLLALLTGTADSSDVGSTVLSENRDRLIQAPALGAPITQTIARRADNLPPIINGLSGLVPRLHTVFGGGSNKNWLHINLQVLGQKGAYTAPADCPKNLGPAGNQYGPNCGASSSSSGTAQSLGSDTAAPLPSRVGGTGSGSADVTSSVLGGSGLTGTDAAPVDLTVDSVGSPAEKALIEQIVGTVNAEQTATHDMSPDLASLFLGPMMRGTDVSFK